MLSSDSIARPTLAAQGILVAPEHFAVFAPVLRLAAVVPLQQNHR